MSNQNKFKTALKRHSWDVSTDQAKNIQEELRHEVIRKNTLGEIHFVAGADVGFDRKNKITRAAVAVLTYPELELHEKAVIHQPTRFPYIPGFLSFREVPALLEAFSHLKTEPDLVLCDSQGIAHQRRFGLACHLGVLTGLPTIGVAKSRLIGSHAPVPEEKGRWVPLTDDGEVLGCVLRTRTRVKPLYISIGHKVDLPAARHYVMHCLTRYRLPETTRWADKLASG